MERTITLHSAGARLAGVLRLPDGLPPGARVPALVCCQGFSLVKEVWLPKNAEALNRAGYATLNIDYRGFGESEGEPRCRLVPWAQVDDVRAALTFLETVPEVDPKRLGLFGISLGASVAVGAAGRDDRVRALVAVAGPADLGRVWASFPDFPRFREKVRAARRAYTSTGEVTYVAVPKLLASDPETCALLVADAPRFPTWRLEITFESLQDLFEFAPEDELPKSRAASLFVYPERDALIARSEMTSLYAKARGEKRLVALPGLAHHEIYNDGPGFEPVMRETLAFLDAHLR
jgi:pimeloyl-ACP methyl ester carboxylesterase